MTYPLTPDGETEPLTASPNFPAIEDGILAFWK
jgi:hypothetical protein